MDSGGEPFVQRLLLLLTFRIQSAHSPSPTSKLWVWNLIVQSPIPLVPGIGFQFCLCIFFDSFNEG